MIFGEILDIDVLYLIVGIILGGIMSAVTSIIAGYWQYKTTIDSAEKDRLRELEKINHEYKLKKLTEKIDAMWYYRNAVVNIYKIYHEMNDFQEKIQKNTLTSGDIGIIAHLLISTKLLNTGLITAIQEINKMNDLQKLEVLSKLQIALIEEETNKAEKYQDKLDYRGWSILLKNRETVKKIQQLNNDIELKFSKVLAREEVEQFKKDFDNQLNEIAELIRKEVHLE